MQRIMVAATIEKMTQKPGTRSSLILASVDFESMDPADSKYLSTCYYAL